ncbi:hypothetical protein [Dyadobacter crusticola]|uniref:hypothetical protein n=1 Tax=Dyadobacter crusticola TaxID=292407 RepID=UPI0004E2729F|nr:hypothetical protein [Dyadobacter crusticola]
MIKRAFVLFFCLVHFLVFPVLAERLGAVCKLELGASNFSIHPQLSTEEADDFVIEDDTLPRNQAIVRADEFEWQESLTDLLRHRHSTYRFITIVDQQAAPEYHITQISKAVRESVVLPAITKGTLVLPGYYGFLHRLCPF